MSTSTGPPPPKKKPTTTTRPMSAGRVRPPTPTAQRRAKLYNCATDDPVLRQKPRSPFQDPVPDDDDDDAPAPRLNLTDAPTHRRRLKHDRASDARFYAGSPTIPPGSWTGAVARYGGSGAHAIGRRCAEKGTGVVASPGREHQVSRCIVARARNVNIRPKMRERPETPDHPNAVVAGRSDGVRRGVLLHARGRVGAAHAERAHRLHGGARDAFFLAVLARRDEISKRRGAVLVRESAFRRAGPFRGDDTRGLRRRRGCATWRFSRGARVLVRWSRCGPQVPTSAFYASQTTAFANEPRRVGEIKRRASLRPQSAKARVETDPYKALVEGRKPAPRGKRLDPRVRERHRRGFHRSSSLRDLPARHGPPSSGGARPGSAPAGGRPATSVRRGGVQKCRTAGGGEGGQTISRRAFKTREARRRGRGVDRPRRGRGDAADRGPGSVRGIRIGRGSPERSDPVRRRRANAATTRLYGVYAGGQHDDSRTKRDARRGRAAHAPRARARERPVTPREMERHAGVLTGVREPLPTETRAAEGRRQTGLLGGPVRRRRTVVGAVARPRRGAVVGTAGRRRAPDRRDEATDRDEDPRVRAGETRLDGRRGRRLGDAGDDPTEVRDRASRRERVRRALRGRRAAAPLAAERRPPQGRLERPLQRRLPQALAELSAVDGRPVLRDVVGKKRRRSHAVALRAPPPHRRVGHGERRGSGGVQVRRSLRDFRTTLRPRRPARASVRGRLKELGGAQGHPRLARPPVLPRRTRGRRRNRLASNSYFGRL